MAMCMTYGEKEVPDEMLMLLVGHHTSIWCAHHQVTHNGEIRASMVGGEEYIGICYGVIQQWCGFNDTELAQAVACVTTLQPI